MAPFKLEKSSSGPEARKVDFVIAGTQKGGTTVLDGYLRQHPSLCLAKLKEVHYFDDDAQFVPHPSYSCYHQKFEPGPQHRLIGESTPMYMYWADAPRRMYDYNRAMKLIVLLRNPITRAYSHWNMEHARGHDTLSFWDAINTESQRCREALPRQHRVYSYVDRGFYLEQLRRLWRFFPPQQVLVLRSEQLQQQTPQTLKIVYDFLGIEHVETTKPADDHTRSYEAPMADHAREYLRRVYEFEIRGLERVLNWDLSHWLA